jgi:hypothetical protein
LSNYQHTHGKDPNSSTLQEVLRRKQKKKGVKAGSGSWLGVVAGYADLHVEAIDSHGSEMIILLFLKFEFDFFCLENQNRSLFGKRLWKMLRW